MTNPTDHELNQVLAAVCGIDVDMYPDISTTQWLYRTPRAADGSVDRFHPFYLKVWNPLHDANQMERVKARLRAVGVEYIITTINLLCDILVEIIDQDAIHTARNGSELRAFALAVWAMDQAQKGTI